MLFTLGIEHICCRIARGDGGAGGGAQVAGMEHAPSAITNGMSRRVNDVGAGDTTNTAHAAT